MRQLNQNLNVLTIAKSSIPPDMKVFKDFIKLWKENDILLASAATEKYYPREEVMEILDLEHALHVNIPVQWTGRIDQGPSAERMLEREREDLQLYEWVRGSDENKEPPPELIPDDVVILQQLMKLSYTSVFIVTDDIQLCERAASTNYTLSIYRIGVFRWIEADHKLSNLTQFGEVHPDQIIVDSGSYDAVVSSLTDEQFDFLEDPGNIRALDYCDLYHVRGRYRVPPVKEERRLMELSDWR